MKALMQFLNNVYNQAASEFFFLIVGSILLYAFQLCKKKAFEAKYRYKVKKVIEYQKRNEEQMKVVVDLGNGDPEFANNHIFVQESTHLGKVQQLFIAMLPEHQKALHQKELALGYGEEQLTRFKQDTTFEAPLTENLSESRKVIQAEIFSSLVTETQIANFVELIEKHRRVVGEKFIQAKDGMIFNGIKYGIFDMRFTRFGHDEQPGVDIYLFETDYFTHRVFRSIYQELKQQQHEMVSANVGNFLQYRAFLTSFGVNALLICNGEKGKEVVLTQRSNRVHNNQTTAMYHITMNEGLSQTDKDPFGKVSLELCFKRGLLEELGINERIYNLGLKSCFYDFFLEKNNFELGISSVFEMGVSFEESIRDLIGRDKNLETDKFFVLPMNRKVIEAFMEKNKANFINHGRYVLNRVLMREGIFVQEGLKAKKKP